MAPRRFGKACLAAVGALYVTAGVSSGADLEVPPIISGYLERMNSVGQVRTNAHDGVDIGGRVGDQILAAADGVVVRAHYDRVTGNRIVVDHGRDSDGDYVRTVYFHNDTNLVKEGDVVRAGDPIGTVGRTGLGLGSGNPHVHFSVFRGPTPRPSPQWRHVDPTAYWLNGRLTCFEPGMKIDPRPLKFICPVACRVRD
jgi:murein DD-endopeptidase MepM/ murein hydrolase activator NlpD